MAEDQICTSWINGKPVAPSASTDYLPIIDPADETEVGRLAIADSDEVNLAVEAARASFDQGTWRHLGHEKRKQILHRFADLIDEHAEELVRLEVTHTGLPIHFVRQMHLPRAAENLRFFSEFVSQSPGQVYSQSDGYITHVVREPVGVCALIGPWNMPLGLSLMKVAASLAFGNSCVLKPSEFTPLSFGLLMELTNQAGLPPGVLNLVNGPGHITGQSLVSHPDVDVISFTGGTETGRRIGALAGGNLKAMSMELGGKSANIVFDDADLQAAVEGALIAAFANNGQACLAGSRLLLHERIADAFLADFVAKAEAIKIGDPKDNETRLGPLQSKRHMEHVLRYVDVAKCDGARILTGGGRAAGFENGYYINPIVAEVASNQARICQEEVFGPFVSVIRFKDLDEAVAIANESEFGLVGYVWTQDIGRAQSVSQRVKAGVMWVNTSMQRDLRAPFGGYKNSGIGREGGEACARLYSEEKTITYKIIPPRESA